MISLTVHSVKQQSEHLYHLLLNETVPLFTEPGQYAVISVPGAQSKAYFAFSSLPGDAASFLIKDDGEAAGFLIGARSGDALSIISVEGKGFQRADATGDVRLFSMGSGIGPLRSLIRYVLIGKWKPAALELWHGAYTADDLPFKEEIQDWQRQGIGFKPCFDREGDRLNVIERLKKEAPDLSDSHIFWVGSKSFGEALLKTATDLGIQRDRFRSNY